MQKPTEEAEKSKVENFLEEYGILVEKYQVDLASYPLFVPDGDGSFKIICQTIPVDLEARKAEAVKQEFMAK